MPAFKRPAAAAASGATAPKAAKALAKKSGLLLDVVKGLSAADLPTPARVMLEEMLDSSLDVCKEQRDQYQSRVVDWVGGVLSTAGKALQARVEESEALVSESNLAREELENKVAAKGGEVETTHGNAVAKKRGFAEAARSYWRAREAVDVAKAKASSDASEAICQAKERGVLAGVLEDFQNHTDSAVGDMVKRLEAVGTPDSMLIALPLTLSKPASERGAFDVMVSTSVKDWLDQRIAAADEAIRNSEPTRVANADALSKAEAALEEMCEQQCDGADVYWKVRAEEEELEKEVQELRQSERALKKAWRAHQASSARAQSNLETFQKGPRNAFNLLREKAEEVAPASGAAQAEGAPQEPAATAEGMEAGADEAAAAQ